MLLNGGDNVENNNDKDKSIVGISYKNIPILDFPKSKTIKFINPYLQRRNTDKIYIETPKQIVVNNYIFV